MPECPGFSRGPARGGHSANIMEKIKVILCLEYSWVGLKRGDSPCSKTLARSLSFFPPQDTGEGTSDLPERLVSTLLSGRSLELIVT